MQTSIEQYLDRRGTDLSALAGKLLLAPGDVAYATGSLFDGLGDSESDIDLYILTSETLLNERRPRFAAERKLQQIRRNFGIEYVTINDQEFDIEVHTIDKLLGMIAALEDLDALATDQIEASFDSLGPFERTEALEFLHRFHIAQPIWNLEQFQSLNRRFPSKRYFQWNATIYLIQAKDFRKGTQRSIREGDYENAYLKLTHLYDALADAFLFASGNSLDRWKWRLPKLRRFAPDAFLNMYLDVQLRRNHLSGGLPDCVLESLRNSERFFAEIEELLHR